MRYDEFSKVCKTDVTKCHFCWLVIHSTDNFSPKVDSIFERRISFVRDWPFTLERKRVSPEFSDILNSKSLPLNRYINLISDTVGKPPRVLLYKVNKTMVKWFNNFLPSECRKFSPIYRRMKGLKRQITKLMPKHQFITAEIENWKQLILSSWHMYLTVYNVLYN